MTISEKDLYKLSKVIHKNNVEKGWWEEGTVNTDIYMKLQLTSTEVAEATEGIRKDLKDDKLPHRSMEEVEFADALIRMLDLGGRLDLQVDFEYIEPIWHCEEHCSLGQQLIGLNRHITNIADYYYWHSNPNFGNHTEDLEIAYQGFLFDILNVSKFRGLDIMGALYEKLEYNKHRADHKKENREQKHGKKF